MSRAKKLVDKMEGAVTEEKSMKDMIAVYKKQFEKVIASHGAESEHTVRAFFHLRAALAGIPIKDMFKWSETEHKKLTKMEKAAFDKYGSTAA